jgi:hypothetical protein
VLDYDGNEATDFRKREGFRLIDLCYVKHIQA